MAKHKKKGNKNRRSGNPYPNQGNGDPKTTKNRSKKQPTTSQDIAKDRDPGTIDHEFTDAEASTRQPTDHPCFIREYKLSDIYDEAQKAIDGMVIGNELYDFWYSDCPQKWSAQVFHFSEQFMDPPDRETFEGAAANIMASVGNCPFALEEFFDKIFEMSEEDREQQPAALEDYYMSCRRLVMATAIRDPTRLFGLTLSTRDSMNLKYWDCSNAYNPTFKVSLERPYSIFWILSAEMMGNPWVDDDGERCETIELFETLQDEYLEVKKKKAARTPPINSEVGNRDSSDGDDASASSPARGSTSAAAVTPQQPSPVKDAPNKGNKEPHKDGSKVSFQLSEDNSKNEAVAGTRSAIEHDQNSKQKESSSSESESDSNSKGKESSSASEDESSGAEEGDPTTNADDKMEDDDDYDLSSIVAHKATGPKNTRSNNPPEKTTTSARTSKNPPANSSLTKKGPPRIEKRRLASSNSKTNPSGQPSSTLKDPPPLQRNKESELPSYAEKALAPPKLLSDDQKVRKLTQISMLGLSCKYSQFFNITMGFHWSGKALEGCSLPDKMVRSVKEYMVEILELDDEITFLPVSDKKYKDSSMWISTVEQLDELVSDLKTLKPYFDVTYGSAGWIAKQPDKLGDKLLRTRMRVGSDSEPDAVRAAITGVLSQSGFNFGCFRSPLNFGSIVECGGCCFWPKTIDRIKYEKELMRIGEFQFAIGLDRGYMRHPAQRTRSYTGQGFVMWKVYAYWKDAPKVNSLLMRALNPRVARKHHPFLFLTFYVPNWQAVTKGLLGVDSFGNVESTIATMLENHRNFDNTTETIHLPLHIPGMLKKVKTKKKGTHSLLALLLCFEASPAQAERAEQEDSNKKSDKKGAKAKAKAKAAPNENTKPKPSDKKSKKEESIVENDEWVSVSKPKKASTKSSTSPEEKEEEKIKKLINQDAHRLDPCKVFIAVSPSSIENETYDFIVRKKMVPLAKRILENPVACLLFHLEEPGRVAECEIIRKWFGNDSLARKNYVNGLAWSQTEMRTISTRAQANNRHQPADELDFLEGLEDPMDAWQGILTLDPDAPELREYDDGLTVAGAMAEIQRFQEMEQEHHRTKAALNEKEVLLREQQRRLKEQEELIARLQATSDRTSQSNETNDVSMTSDEQTETSAPRGGGSSTPNP